MSRLLGHGWALCLVAGGLAALGQAPWGLWPLALMGYGAGLWLIAQAGGPRHGFGRAWLFGAAHFAVSLHWITEPFFVDADVTGWMAPFALIGLSGGLAVFWGAAGALGVWLRSPVAVALALVGAEAGRSYVLTGFPWALPGHIWIQSPALPLAGWLGPLGLTACALVPAAFVMSRKAWVAVAVWAGIVGLGAMVPPAPISPEAAVVRLVQPNAPQHLKWQPDMIPVFFRRGLVATAETPVGANPVLVVWPETSLPELAGVSAASRGFVSDAAGPARVLVGAQRFDTAGAPRNTALLLGPDGEIEASYDKHHLVPFGEYLPLQRLFDAIGIGGFAAQLAGGYQSGDGPVTLGIPGLGPIFAMICYEAIFPQYIRSQPRPAVMIHLTNDAWFGGYAGPAQHLALAQLRAAEQGLGLLRAANTGVSASIDARGKILDALPLGVSGHLDVAVPPALPATVYARSGDLPWVLAIFLCLLGLFAAGRRNPH